MMQYIKIKRYIEYLNLSIKADIKYIIIIASLLFLVYLYAFYNSVFNLYGVRVYYISIVAIILAIIFSITSSLAIILSIKNRRKACNIINAGAVLTAAFASFLCCGNIIPILIVSLGASVPVLYIGRFEGIIATLEPYLIAISLLALIFSIYYSLYSSISYDSRCSCDSNER
ncbi:MAG: hypothetical protein ARM1_0719 [Candidatus Micrarchaeota archaeon]|nr:MAG: hypothetical protein ARM1_0719 [Candidatus Micrarchaeota archaeon]